MLYILKKIIIFKNILTNHISKHKKLLKHDYYILLKNFIMNWIS